MDFQRGAFNKMKKRSYFHSRLQIYAEALINGNGQSNLILSCKLTLADKLGKTLNNKNPAYVFFVILTKDRLRNYILLGQRVNYD